MKHTVIKKNMKLLGLQDKRSYIDFLLAYDRALKNPAVAFVGEFSSGKTSLIEALIGEGIGPVGVLEATRVPIYFVYGRTKEVFTVSTGRSPIIERHGFKQLPALAASTGIADWILVTLPIDELSTLGLIDTPGANASTSYLLDFRPTVSYVWCSPYGDVFSETQLQTIREIGTTTTHWIATKTDLVDEDEEDEIEELFEETLQHVPFRNASRRSSPLLRSSEEEREQMWKELAVTGEHAVASKQVDPVKERVTTELIELLLGTLRPSVQTAKQKLPPFETQRDEWKRALEPIEQKKREAIHPVRWCEHLYSYVCGEIGDEDMRKELIRVIQADRRVVKHEAKFRLTPDDRQSLDTHIEELKQLLDHLQHPAMLELFAGHTAASKELEAANTVLSRLEDIVRQDDHGRQSYVDWPLTVDREAARYLKFLQTVLDRTDWLERIDSNGTFEWGEDDRIYFETEEASQEQIDQAEWIDHMNESEAALRRMDRDSLYIVKHHAYITEDPDPTYERSDEGVQPWQRAKQLLARFRQEKADAVSSYEYVERKRRRATEDLSDLVASMNDAHAHMKTTEPPSELNGVNQVMANTLKSMARAVEKQNEPSRFEPLPLGQVPASPSPASTGLAYAFRKWNYPRFYMDWFMKTLLLYLLFDGVMKLSVLGFPRIWFGELTMSVLWPVLIPLSALIAWPTTYVAHRRHEHEVVWRGYEGDVYRRKLRETRNANWMIRVGLTLFGLYFGYESARYSFYYSPHIGIIVMMIYPLLLNALVRKY